MDYRDLKVWQLAIELCNRIYDITETFPKSETYGLSGQLRRSAVSIASNIAEGEGRLTPGERRQALSQARGSLFEVSTQLIIARNRRYICGNPLHDDLEKLRRKLDAYISYVRRC